MTEQELSFFGILWVTSVSSAVVLVFSALVVVGWANKPHSFKLPKSLVLSEGSSVIRSLRNLSSVSLGSGFIFAD